MTQFRFLMFFLLIFSLAFFTELQSATKKEKLLKIGAVDLQKVFTKSPGKKIAEDQLEKSRKSYDEEKLRRETEIKKMKDDFKSKEATLSSSDKEKILLDIQKKTIELKEYIETSNLKLEEEENKLLSPLIDDIKGVIAAVSVLYGYDIILDKSTYILYIDREYDITDEVIQQLEAKYKK